MRVHPSVLAPRTRSWQFSVAFALLLVVVLVNVLGKPRDAAPLIIPQAPTENKIEVLVAKESIQAGQPLDQAKVALEQRPATTLPADAINSFEVLKNKVAAGPIPAGNPLSMTFLAEPVTIVQTQEEPVDSVKEDPIDAMLLEIEKDTVALPVVFASPAPSRGARVALTLLRGRGESVLMVEDCWVSKSSGREAILRLTPNQALLVQSARSYGNFGFIEIPSQGKSPYEGTGVADEATLKRLIEAQNGGPKPPVADANPKTPDKRIKGYAWVPGEGIRYGLDEDGQIKVIQPGE